MTLSKNASGLGLSSIAQSFCRVVFCQVPPAGSEELKAAQREAFSSLSVQEREALAMEEIALECEEIGGSSAAPVLAKFKSLIESIEEQARHYVLDGFSIEERLKLKREEDDYARAFAEFHRQSEVLSSKPGQTKIFLPPLPQKGPLYQRFERQMRKAVEDGTFRKARKKAR